MMKEIIQILKECLTKKYACFKGRANRKEFWYFALGNLIVYIALPLAGLILGGLLGLISKDLGGVISGIFMVALAIWYIAVIVPGLAVQVRRLHDLGKSGWTILVMLIPIIGPIILLVWYCKAGMPVENQYGEPEA